MSILLISGSDSIAGAGMQADLKTAHSLDTYAASVVTSIVAENTHKVISSFPTPLTTFRDSLNAVVDDFLPTACKIGMISGIDLIKETADFIKTGAIKNVVLDPVFVATAGKTLVTEKALSTIRNVLMTHCTLITPNKDETFALTTIKPVNIKEKIKACAVLIGLGANACLITGGDDDNSDVVEDVLMIKDHKDVNVFRKPKVPSKIHGTGCTLSTAIACYLDKGLDLIDAVKEAEQYVEFNINNALKIGKGALVLPHKKPDVTFSSTQENIENMRLHTKIETRRKKTTIEVNLDTIDKKDNN